MDEQSRTKNSIKNISFSFGTYAISLILSLINRLYFVQLLSNEYLGLNGLFSNILNFLSLAELGVGGAINFALYTPISEGDTERIKSLMRLYKRFYVAIGIIILVTGGCLAPVLPVLIKDMPEEIPQLTQYYLLYVISSGISYFYTYKRSLIICNQKEYLSSITTAIAKILITVLQIILLWLTHSYAVYLLVSIILTVGENICISKIADRMYPYLKDKTVKKLPTELVLDIKKNIGAMVFHKIGAAVVFSTDNIIISQFVGLAAVGLYSNYTLVINSVNSIMGRVFTAIIASVGSLIAANDVEHTEEVFHRVLFLNYWIRSFCTIAFFCLIQPFITLWIGDKYLLNMDTVIIITLNFYFGGMRTAVNTFKDASGLFWYDRYKPLIEGVLNLVLSIPLAIRYGVAGVLLGTIGSTLLVPFWFEAYILFKYLFHKRIWRYIGKQILFAIATLSVGGICVICCNMIHGDNILSFISRILICAVLPNLCMVVLWHRTEEFGYFLEIIKKIRGGNAHG